MFLSSVILLAQTPSSGHGLEALIERLGNIVNFLLSLLLVVGMGAIMIAGYQYMASAGSPDKQQQAKSALWWAVLGFVVIACAKGILIFVLSVIGVNPSLFGL